MEWCRMYTYRALLCVTLLCCGLDCVVQDKITMPDRESRAQRDQKWQEMLKYLEKYSTELHTDSLTKEASTIESATPNPTVYPTLPTFSRQTETRQRSNSESHSESILPETSQIKNYQDFYKKFTGTQEGVDMLRKQYGPNGLQKARSKYGVNKQMEAVRLANAHILKIRSKARCHKPAPQLVRVKDYHNDPSKEYVPRCTILHRCGDESGCCDNEAFTCVPSAQQTVTLHFYVMKVGRYGLDPRGSVEALLFDNHTACQCQMKNDRPRIQDGTDSTTEDFTTSNSKCGECPVPFTSRIYKDGRCGCDCFDKQKPCLRVKRGREPLHDMERGCVESKYCHVPDCEFGLFNMVTGYCPKRNGEEPKSPHRRQTYGSSNQRWAFHERD